MNGDQALAALRNVVGKDTLLCTDGSLAFRKIQKELKVPVKSVYSLPVSRRSVNYLERPSARTNRVDFSALLTFEDSDDRKQAVLLERQLLVGSNWRYRP
jgi:hypothetical protein